jgi:glycosyltransferase involved in cell wall biosynthesis
MNDILLTICVPTRNRCEALGKAVAETCARITSEGALGKVRLLVFDDCSNDATEARVQTIVEQHGIVEYFRSETRVGYDKGLLRCLELATTRYVWTMNDHSSILPGVLRRVLEKLSEDPGYIYVHAPQKGDLALSREVHAVAREALGLVNMSINTNIYNRELLIPCYQRRLPAYDGSWLAFQVANLDLLYENPSGEILLLPFECSEYGKHMGAERANNSWSTNREQYVRTGYYGARLLADTRAKHSIRESVYKRVLGRRAWGIDACVAYMHLWKMDETGKRFDRGLIAVIAGHPTFNAVERWIVRGSLGAKRRLLPCYEAALTTYMLLMAPHRVLDPAAGRLKARLRRVAARR